MEEQNIDDDNAARLLLIIIMIMITITIIALITRNILLGFVFDSVGFQ